MRGPISYWFKINFITHYVVHKNQKRIGNFLRSRKRTITVSSLDEVACVSQFPTGKNVTYIFICTLNIRYMSILAMLRLFMAILWRYIILKRVIFEIVKI